MDKEERKEEATRTGAAAPKVKWDDSGMSTSYANVCNAFSTREEVALLFGTNQTLYTGQNEFMVKLSNRIIISPFAAKRLLQVLGNVVNQYEKRFGQLDVVSRDTGEKKT
jgi:hypothetical protein